MEATLRAATADEGAAAAVQSGRLLRGLSADGVDVVDLSGAVALPGLVVPAAADRVPRSPGLRNAAGTPAARNRTAPGKRRSSPGCGPSGRTPRRSTPSALQRARAALKDAEDAAEAAAQEARQREEELSASTALATELADAVRTLREQLSEREQELKAARKRRELAAARAQQAARAAAKARRTEDLARERVLRLGNTPH